MNKSPQEKFLEQIAMLLEYNQVFPVQDNIYTDDSEYSQAVSTTLLKMFVDNSIIKLGQPQCFNYVKQCQKQNKSKDSKLLVIMSQIKQYLTSDPVENVHLVIRGYMQNMVIIQLLQDLTLDPQQTAEYFDSSALFMDRQCRIVLRQFLKELQELTFTIQLKPSTTSVSLKQMRERVQQFKDEGELHIQPVHSPQVHNNMQMEIKMNAEVVGTDFNLDDFVQKSGILDLKTIDLQNILESGLKIGAEPEEQSEQKSAMQEAPSVFSEKSNQNEAEKQIQQKEEVKTETVQIIEIKEEEKVIEVKEEKVEEEHKQVEFSVSEESSFEVVTQAVEIVKEESQKEEEIVHEKQEEVKEEIKVEQNTGYVVQQFESSDSEPMIVQQPIVEPIAVQITEHKEVQENIESSKKVDEVVEQMVEQSESSENAQITEQLNQQIIESVIQQNIEEVEQIQQEQVQEQKQVPREKINEYVVVQQIESSESIVIQEPVAEPVVLQINEQTETQTQLMSVEHEQYETVTEKEQIKEETQESSKGYQVVQYVQTVAQELEVVVPKFEEIISESEESSDFESIVVPQSPAIVQNSLFNPFDVNTEIFFKNVPQIKYQSLKQEREQEQRFPELFIHQHLISELNEQVLFTNKIEYEQNYCKITDNVGIYTLNQEKENVTSLKKLRSAALQTENLPIANIIHQIKHATQYNGQKLYTFQEGLISLSLPVHLQQVDYKVYFPTMNMDEQLEHQHNQCFGCANTFKPSESIWFCQYSGKYYCEHCKFVSVQLPSLIRQGEIAPVNVNVDFQQDISNQMQSVSILNECLPLCIKRNKKYQQALQLRRVILSLYYLISPCQNTKISSELFLEISEKIKMQSMQLQPDQEISLTKEENQIEQFQPKYVFGRKREYLGAIEQAVLVKNVNDLNKVGILSVGYWSWRDIFEILNDNLIGLMNISLEQLKQHIINCECCKHKSQHCICYEEVYAFSEEVLVCPKCGTICHIKCCDGICPGCGFK
ncbi:Conserved_hypothetical protein [Hexamita inflata]|uniref:Rubicon Homology domain-containing protein n=1 Tax=Hexamita inflata TaxID=28002 RepID=A0AA86R0K8_9EUKA|nr:Conserved hypothetical protein [Hexamita inflata]